MFLKRSDYEFMLRRMKIMEEQLNELLISYDALMLLIERETEHFSSSFKKMEADFCESHNLGVFGKIVR